MLADILLVIVFAATGRASHEESAFGLGLITTAWPFLAALAIGWIVSLAWKRPSAVVPTGVIIWAVTVAGGLGLRVAAGATAAVPFIIVATITLAIFLLGWRIIVTLIARRKR